MGDPKHIVCPHCDSVNSVALSGQPACCACGQPLFTAHPVELNGNNFLLHVTRNDIPVLVDFWSPACRPCQLMAPAYEKIAQRLEPEVRVAKLNADDAQQIIDRYGVQFIPTLILFQAGREVARKSGAMNAVYIEAWVKNNSGAKAE